MAIHHEAMREADEPVDKPDSVPGERVTRGDTTKPALTRTLSVGGRWLPLASYECIAD